MSVPAGLPWRAPSRAGSAPPWWADVALAVSIGVGAVAVVGGEVLPLWWALYLAMVGVCASRVRWRTDGDAHRTVWVQAAVVFALTALPLQLLPTLRPTGRAAVAYLVLAGGVFTAVTFRSASRRPLGPAVGAALLLVAGSEAPVALPWLVVPWAVATVVVLGHADWDATHEASDPLNPPLPLGGDGPRRWGARVATAGVAGALLVAGLGPLVAGADLQAVPGVGEGAAGEGGTTARSDRSAPAGETGGSALRSSDRMDTSTRSQPGDAVVLRVQADAPHFLRGEVYDAFDGVVWTRTPALRADAPRGEELPAPGVPVESFEQDVLVVGGPTDVLFAAAEPTDAAVLTGRGRLRFGPGGTVRSARLLDSGDRYVARSARVLATAQLLRERDPRAPGAPAVDPAFLAVPADTPQRVRQLARDVAGDAPTTYDAVRALEAHLGATTRYSLDIPPLPAGADAVDQYLFVDRVGYCEQIASALAVLLRELGVPARVATGYVAQERDEARNEWVVRERNAHAWVEVLFPGVGWTAFDPTAEVPLAGEQPDDATPWWMVPAAVGLVAAVAAVAAVALWRARRGRAERPWAVVATERLDAWAMKVGLARRPDETLLAWAARVRPVLTALPGPGGPAAAHTVGEVTVRLTAALYGPQPPDPAGAAAVDGLLAGLPRRLPRRTAQPVPSGAPGAPGASGSVPPAAAVPDERTARATS